MTTTYELHELTQMGSTWPIDAVGAFAIDSVDAINRDKPTEDDAWISSLLPMPSTSSSSSSQLKNSHKKDISLYAYDYYKEAYQNISILSTEPISNEEWTARKFQRERRTRSYEQVSHEQNHPVQQYYRSDQRGPRERFILEQELLLSQVAPNVTASNHDSQEYLSRERAREEHPRTTRPRRVPSSTIFHRESLINRSRNVVSNAFRLLKSFSRNNRQAASTSEVATLPTWVGRGAIEDVYGSNRAGQDTMAGISGIRRRTEIHPFYYGDEHSNDDTAYWTTGTAIETIYESDSSHSPEPEEIESVLSTEEHQMDKTTAYGDGFLEWHCTETQQGNEVPLFAHDPFVQFRPREENFKCNV